MEKKIDVYEACKNADKIIVSGHINPDGDCIGSTLAMTLYLKKRLPGCDIRLLLEDYADCFKCVRNIDLIRTDFQANDPDVFIVIDTENNRLGNAEKFFKSAGYTINIDHHISNEGGCADLNYVDAKASSASELVRRLIPDEYMDEEIAEAIYLGIVHDTGVFKYSCTSPETLRIAAELIGYGFDFPTLIDKTFYEKSYKQNLAMAKILLESSLYLDGRLIVGVIDLKQMNSLGITSKDFDGVINQLRITEGVECAAFLHQMNQSTYKVSLRSKKIIDCSKIAVSFGGGGHVRASGFFTNAEAKEIIDKITAQVAEQFETVPGGK
ncbi:MAG: bifunctional oligoribonuclease/PAP phosphatase NrnA [Lachnospiraceae bacterium]|nr:bifunctional oligoribonuclease/PAP phosphatase NrnA [Lachnospiraceae bacterium]